MAIKKSFVEVTKQREAREYFNSDYGFAKKTGMGIGVEAYIVLLGLDSGIYSTPKHTVSQRKVGSSSIGFKGKFNTNILCKGYDSEGNKVEGAVCCMLAQAEKDRLPEKADSSKRMISFTNNVIHLPVMILGSSEKDPKVKKIPPHKLSIKTYDFSYLELAQSTFNKTFMEELATSLKNSGALEYDLEGEELQIALLNQLKNTIIKVTGVPSDSVPYERSYSFIPFSMEAIGKSTEEYKAITEYTKNKQVMNDITDFLMLFDSKVGELVVDDWKDEDLIKYVQEDTKRAENVKSCVEAINKQDEIVTMKEDSEEVESDNLTQSMAVDEALDNILTEEDIFLDDEDDLFDEED